VKEAGGRSIVKSGKSEKKDEPVNPRKNGYGKYKRKEQGKERERGGRVLAGKNSLSFKVLSDNSGGGEMT